MCVDLINGKTQVYGIIGNPVEKSFSPILQNTIAEEFGKKLPMFRSRWIRDV